MPSIPVKWFRNTMENAPVVDNSFGRLTNLLDALLINGFNQKNVTSITRDGTLATITCGTHGYLVDQVVLIAGADQAEYNGEFRVISKTTTTLTVEVAGTPVTPATGTITIKTAPIGGWEIYKTDGASKRAYRSTNPQSNKRVLRIDDGQGANYTATYAKIARVAICEDMTDIDTPLGKYAPFDSTVPLKGWTTVGTGGTIIAGWYKWRYAQSSPNYNHSESDTPATGNREWTVIGDDRGFFLTTTLTATAGATRATYMFTDFQSFRPGDQYDCVLVASDDYNQAQANRIGSTQEVPDWATYATRSHDSTGKVLLTDYTQTGAPRNVFFISLHTRNAQQHTGLSTDVAWPNPANFGLLLHPVYLMENSLSSVRGRMPGLRWVHNNTPTYLEGDILTGIEGEPGKKFYVMRGWSHMVGTTWYAVDITGPWY